MCNVAKLGVKVYGFTFRINCSVKNACIKRALHNRVVIGTVGCFTDLGIVHPPTLVIVPNSAINYQCTNSILFCPLISTWNGDVGLKAGEY